MRCRNISFSSGELTVIVQTVRFAAYASGPQPTANSATRRKTLANKDTGQAAEVVCMVQRSPGDQPRSVRCRTYGRHPVSICGRPPDEKKSGRENGPGRSS